MVESAFLRAIVGGSLRSPRSTLFAWSCFLLVAAIGLARLEIDTSTASFLDRTAAEWRTYQDSVATFGGDEFLVVALAGDSAFEPSVLSGLAALTGEIETYPGVRRVDSLATVPAIRRSEGGGVRVDPALVGEEDVSELRAREIAQVVRGDRIARRGLVSADERTFAINLMLDEDVDADRAQTVSAVRSVLAGRDAWVSGVPVFRTEVNSRTQSEIGRFVPITVSLMAMVLAAIFRSAQGVLLPLLVGVVGAAVSLGVMGGLGVTLSLSTLILPSVLLALGCAYSMHVLTAARGLRGSELERALHRVSVPVAYSGLTTVIGFLAMATVRVDAIRELATFGAVGVFGITAVTLSGVPAALALWPLLGGNDGTDRAIRLRLSGSLVGWVVRRSRKVVIAWAVVLVAAAVGLWKLDVATDIILWFPERSEIRQSYESIRSQLAGITPVNVVVRSSNGGTVTEPDVVSAVDRLQAALELLPVVGKAISMADPIRQIHAALDDDAGEEIPKDRQTIEQYLLLLSGVEYVNDVVSLDRSAANVLLRLDVNSSEEIVSLGDWVDRWWRENGVAGFGVETTGIMYEFGRAEEEIAYGQIRGLVVALGAIGAVLLAILRCWRRALVALLPNVIPLGVAFGFMGLVGITLDAATVCLGSLALGVAVDDTIHVVTSFQRERVRGKGPEMAMRNCMAEVLPALLFTTAAVALGFAVLGTSHFTLIRNLGFVTAGLVTVCLLADVTLLPALLVREKRRN